MSKEEGDNIKQLRSNLSLDFNPSQTKKTKFETCVLETPDLARITNFSDSNPHSKKMKYDNCLLGTPDMAKIGISTPELNLLALNAFQSNSLNTFSRNDDLEEDKPKITDWANQTTKSIKNEEIVHEDYKYIPSRSFDEKNNDHINMNQELEPIDMADQERIKLERKRHRNRIAASKCRQRKLERIAKLQDRVSKLKSKNEELDHFTSTVREIINRLSNHFLAHKEMGCDIHR